MQLLRGFFMILGKRAARNKRQIQLHFPLFIVRFFLKSGVYIKNQVFDNILFTADTHFSTLELDLETNTINNRK